MAAVHQRSLIAKANEFNSCSTNNTDLDHVGTNAMSISAGDHLKSKLAGGACLVHLHALQTRERLHREIREQHKDKALIISYLIYQCQFHVEDLPRTQSVQGNRTDRRMTKRWYRDGRCSDLKMQVALPIPSKATSSQLSHIAGSHDPWIAQQRFRRIQECDICYCRNKATVMSS
ncbi:hypothetical protein IG631_06002 [Alternaria alternata]|nr:hypothetical protein IG631_06002 [Alternaria alternata]